MARYGTGGLAVTNLRAGYTFNENAFGNTVASALSETEVGWTVGAGVETMFAGGWRVALEYLYVSFDTASATAPVLMPLGAGGGTTSQNLRQSADLSSNIVRVKLNYAFNAPLMAKY
jgi:outer membrane immunogenic protein